MPHVSIAIPVFNRAHLVDKTIESVLSQSLVDWDLVVVDDASTDETVSVVQRYAGQDSRIKLFINERNLGLTRNWNRCLDLAKGPLIQILLSDDLVDSDYLENVSKTFDAYPTVGIVAANCRYINATGIVIDAGKSEESHLYRAGDEAVSAFLKGHPHVSSIVFKKECVNKLGGFNEKIWHGPDVEMDSRIAKHFDYYRFGSPYTSFRRHGSNMGALEYLREDFLEADYLKVKMAWSYLSKEALASYQIRDLDRFVSSYAAGSALTGVPITIAYGKTRVGYFYLGQSLKFDFKSILKFRFWKCLAMLMTAKITRRLILKRMSIDENDQKSAQIVEGSLRKLKQSRIK